MEDSNLISEENSEQSFNNSEQDIDVTDDNSDNTETEAVEAGNTIKTATSSTPSDLNKPVKFVRLPLARIKQLMKLDPDIHMIQHDAIFLTTKATEMFIELLVRESSKALGANKRKTVQKRDVDLAIESIPQLCFLDGALE